MNILITGGTGYIGSHAAVVLAEAGCNVVLYDNLCNSKVVVVERLVEITGQLFPLIKGDVRNRALLIETLQKHKIDAVIHFAGLKAVGESVEKPIEYYDNNVSGTVNLLQAMLATNIKILVFSSSATVYGEPQYLPIDENHPIRAINPYGRSKTQIEEFLVDAAESDSTWRIACLRYFNPVGAHESGLIGEDPKGIPNNLMAYIAHVAVGKLLYLNIFGDDYKTLDGTGIRDYIHVVDLAEGHLAALNYLTTFRSLSLNTFNLGTGIGLSVLEMISAFESSSKKKIKYQIVKRRSGDVAVCYANVEKAKNILGWQARRHMSDMCASVWKFQSLLNSKS